MSLQYQLIATKPDGKMLFWNYRGFTANEAHSAKMISLDFADWSAILERESHPTWDFKIRISEAI